MPPWGRPLGAIDGRTRREMELQREWEGRHRFQELDSEDSEAEATPMRRRRVTGDKLHFTGYDLGSGQQGSDGRGWHDYSGSYGMDEDDYHDRRSGWQIARRDKEEELVERALRRIRRAKLRGESNVNLSREELDALERDRMRQEEPPNRAPQRARPPTSPTQPKKNSSGLFGLSGGQNKIKKPLKRPSLPSEEATQRRSASNASTERSTSATHTPPAREMMRSTSSPSKASTGPGSNTATRSASNGSRRLAQAPAYDLERDPTRYVAATLDSQRRFPPLRPGNPRTLPDDPNWIPRVRSASSTSQLPYPTAASPTDQYGYPIARRNFSGPASLSYPSVRRAVHPPATRGAGIGRSSPVGTSPGEAFRGGSALSQEVIEISSDEGSETDLIDGDDDSDDGVRVDIGAGDDEGYIRARRPGGRR